MKLLSDTALITKLITNKTFRDAHVYEHVRNGVPFQIRAMRDERGWTQGQLGERAGKPRNVVTRLEDPNYGKLTLKTLLEIASAFEVALLVKFVPFSRLLQEYEDTSVSALGVQSIMRENRKLMRWAKTRDSRGEGDADASRTHQIKLPFDSPAIATDRRNVVPFPIHKPVDEFESFEPYETACMAISR